MFGYYPAGHFLVLDSLVLAGDNASYSFQLISSDGRFVRTIRRRFTPSPIVAKDVEDGLRGLLTRPYMDQLVGKQWYPVLAAMPRPESKPAYDMILVTKDELWVREFTMPRTPGMGGSALGSVPLGATTFSVFDHQGHWLSQVRIPAGFKPTAVGRDRIVGIWLDDEDVVQLRAYRLHRTSEVP